MNILLISGVILLFSTVSATSSSGFVNNADDNKFIPSFLSFGQKYSIAIGSTIVLPCKIDETVKPDHYALTWKTDEDVLTAQNLKVIDDSRIRLVPQIVETKNKTQIRNYNLEIHDVVSNDAGNYTCQLGTKKRHRIVHSLEILEPPRISYAHPKNTIDVSTEEIITLECRATGKPTPSITWSRKNNVMPSGEANITKNVLKLINPNRHYVGRYRCTADNGVGEPAYEEVTINVLFAPEIEVEQDFVQTGVGYEAQLICIVHAVPPPNVIWYKENTQLGITERHSHENRGNRHTLVLRNVTLSDLGNYTCQASNNLGKDRAVITLSGLPTIGTFDSPTISNYRDQYNISWTVQSYDPIVHYKIYYKKADHANSIGNNRYGNNFHQSSHHLNGNWLAVDIPEKYILQYQRPYHPYATNHNTYHKYHYLIKHLTPASNYVAKVQARNHHGWNELSNTFQFSTRAEDIEMDSSVEPAVLKTAGVVDKDSLINRSSINSVTSITTKLVAFVSILIVLLSL